MNKLSIRANPAWRKPHRLMHSNFPEAIWSWLLDPASLTRRLQALCNGEFRVQLLSQGWSRPTREEARVLNLRTGAYANVREVYLFCREHPCVFARTVIPARTLSGRYRRLTHLGSKSLGAVLFADKSTRRSNLELARIIPGQHLFTRATRSLHLSPQIIWGRRSLFQLANQPLLLSELFLCDMPPC